VLCSFGYSYQVRLAAQKRQGAVAVGHLQRVLDGHQVYLDDLGGFAAWPVIQAHVAASTM
jgi:hypothetical protein